MTDKSKELDTFLTLINDKLHFEGFVDGNPPVSIDYTPPLGDNLGYTSLELLLLSLSSCLGSDGFTLCEAVTIKSFNRPKQSFYL